jgi:bacterioferritin (cytochrome b1)
MKIDMQELELLNFYRASELQGGLVLGKMVGRARDPELILELTRHAAEEVGHAQLWTETIVALGGRPFPTRDTYQRRYAEVLGAPRTLLEVLALTQVFERRVYRHFTAHLHRPGTDPIVCATLKQMLREERGHLSWVKHWLDAQTGRAEFVHAVMQRYADADARIYDELTLQFGWRHAA